MKGEVDHARVARRIETKIGDLVLFASDLGLAGLFFGHRVEDRGLPPNKPTDLHLNAAERQLAEYFEGGRKHFEVVLDARGTDFQMSVWEALSEIPFGETRSYGEIAEAIGRPKSVRAVGLANGANPISIIVPCHRVIGADGSLTGFGGGLSLKRDLLVHEGSLLDLSASREVRI